MYYLGIDFGRYQHQGPALCDGKAARLLRRQVSYEPAAHGEGSLVMTLSLCAVSLRKGSRWPALVSAAPAR